ncbi:MAG: DUF3445 domain-containing protein [Planctomycetes bacterium]|nr:DUF3445 domain-containing protein [Planctomycetota bacterium]
MPPHPYRDGYRLTPQLKGIAPQDVFNASESHRAALIAAKQQVPSEQIWHVEEECPTELKADVLRYIRDSSPDKVPETDSLPEIALHLAEDFVIHRQTEIGDRMALAAVMLPTGWRPEEKLGLSFREIHSVVPGMDLTRSESLVDAVIHGGPFERYVWGVRFAHCWNDHPDLPRASFDPEHPTAFVKLERQVTVGFPEHAALLFLIRQEILPPELIDRAALAKTLGSMTPEQIAYKGLTKDLERLLEWLEAKAGQAPA